MTKKSGKAGTVVAPMAPKEAVEADKADPGEVEKVKAKQVKAKSGKYGAPKVKPFKPPEPGGGGGGSEANEDSEEKKKSWIEIELVGEDKKPIPGERYRITLPDGSVAEGTLDEKGFARVEGFEPGSCMVTFPDLDQDAWEDS